MAVTLTYGRYGPRIYGPNGCQQHRLTDYRRRRQTRAGNEFLYHGVHGYSALRKFAGGHRGRENWRASHTFVWWDWVYSGSSLVCAVFAGTAAGRPTDLCADWHHPPNGNRHSTLY